jgi:hypothetical protein
VGFKAKEDWIAGVTDVQQQMDDYCTGNKPRVTDTNGNGVQTSVRFLVATGLTEYVLP